MDFAIHIALLEAVLGSHGTFTVSRATLVCWCGASLVPVGTVIGSRGACLASHEVELGSQGTLIVSTETCFSEVAKDTLAILTFLYLRICRGLLLPSSLGQSE